MRKWDTASAIWENHLLERKRANWKESWFVIGYEDLCGDPIFVDLAKPEFPVFTAAHREGDWSPEMIASSFQGLIEALQEVNRLSEGRENPVKLERNPISAVERERVLRKSRCGITSGSNVFFRPPSHFLLIRAVTGVIFCARLLGRLIS